MSQSLLDAQTDCGIPTVKISDWDAKFMSELWTKIGKIKGMKIQATTAWHPQADG